MYMDKFLGLIESHTPADMLDDIIKGKRELQRFLLANGVKSDVKTFKDTLSFKLPSGLQVTVEVVEVTGPIEDQEEELDPIETIVSLDDDKISDEIKGAKSQVTSALTASANKISAKVNEL